MGAFAWPFGKREFEPGKRECEREHKHESWIRFELRIERAVRSELEREREPKIADTHASSQSVAVAFRIANAG